MLLRTVHDEKCSLKPYVSQRMKSIESALAYSPVVVKLGYECPWGYLDQFWG